MLSMAAGTICDPGKMICFSPFAPGSITDVINRYGYSLPSYS
jgi:hypothetical protein